MYIKTHKTHDTCVLLPNIFFITEVVKCCRAIVVYHGYERVSSAGN